MLVGDLVRSVRCCMPEAFLAWISPGVQISSSRYSSRAQWTRNSHILTDHPVDEGAWRSTLSFEGGGASCLATGPGNPRSPSGRTPVCNYHQGCARHALNLFVSTAKCSNLSKCSSRLLFNSISSLEFLFFNTVYLFFFFLFNSISLTVVFLMQCNNLLSF